MLTNAEGKKLIKILLTFYPNSFKTLSDENMESMVKSYQQVFSDFDYNEVKDGLLAFIRTDSSGFPPTPAKIIQLFKEIKAREKHNQEIREKIEHDMNMYKNLTREEKIKANEDWKIITGDSEAFIFEDV